MYLSSTRIIISCVIIFYFLFAQLNNEVFAATKSDFQSLPTLSNSLADCSDTSQCDNVGSVCFNGPNNNDSGGCGTACGKENAWSKFEIKCKNLETDPNKIERCAAGLVYLEAVCATGDKCFAGQTGLHAGSCTCGNYSQNITKYCCNASGYAEACTTSGAPQDNQPPAEGQCPGGYIIDGYRVKSSACTPIVVAPTTPTCSDGSQNGNETGVDCGGSCPACAGPPAPTAPVCGAACIYSEDGACKSGNCFDGSNNCSFNINCSYVSGCSTGNTVACPGGGNTPPPAGPPPGSCTIAPSCTNGHCVFNINYVVDNASVSSFNTVLYPDLVQSSDPSAELQVKPGTSTANFSSGQTVDWDYDSGSYQAGVRVAKTNGESITNCRTTTFAVNLDTTPPTCTSMTLLNSSGQVITAATPVERGSQIIVDFNLNDTGSKIGLAEFFTDGQVEAQFYNTLNQNPFQKTYGYNTTGLPNGTHTFVINASDYAGNVMQNNATCTKQVTITTPTWIPPQCNTPGNFTGCTLQNSTNEGTTCSDAGPGDPQYPNWSQNLGNLCQTECAKPAAERCTSPFGTLTVPTTVGRNGPTAWANMQITFNTTNTQGGEVFIHSSTCAQASCNPNVGWTLTNATCTTTANGSKTCTYTPPNTIPINTSRTFALFGKNPRIILDTKNTRFGQVCTPGDQQAVCTTNVCTI